MEQDKRSAADNTYTFTPEPAIGRVPKTDLIDLTALRTENQLNEQAADVIMYNSTGAAALVADSLWEYALLLGNDRDDGPEVNAAANDAANANHFLALFRESFQEFRQTAEYGKLLLGEQAKWRPTLRDANGHQIGQLNHVLLNPVLSQLGTKPVVQIILPNRDYRQEVASRLRPDQQQALEHGRRPVAFLERRTILQDDITVQNLLTMMTPPTTDQPQRIKLAMHEYRQAQATTKPEDVAGLRHFFQHIVQHTLGLQGFRYETVLDKMLEVNQLQRVTYHPDINVLGKQPIHLQTVPIAYKGVALQPAQIKNLLLGNSIEVAGLRDERRSGLYRASVRFNVLHNKLEGDSKREELRTDNKADFKHHQREVHQRSSDDHRTLPNHHSSKEQAVGSQRDTIQRPAFRPGR